MSIYQWLCVAGVPTIIGLLIGIFIKRPIERRVQEAEAAALENRQKSEAIALGVQALLRDRLLQGYKHYEAQGWAEYDDKSNMDNMYLQYHNLGENGVMTRRHEHFMAMPDHQ